MATHFFLMQEEFTWEGREGINFSYTEADTLALQKTTLPLTEKVLVLFPYSEL